MFNYAYIWDTRNICVCVLMCICMCLCAYTCVFYYIRLCVSLWRPAVALNVSLHCSPYFVREGCSLNPEVIFQGAPGIHLLQTNHWDYRCMLYAWIFTRVSGDLTSGLCVWVTSSLSTENPSRSQIFIILLFKDCALTYLPQIYIYIVIYFVPLWLQWFF